MAHDDPATTLARAGDAVAEMLGVVCARTSSGEPLDPRDADEVRASILRWHLIKADALARPSRG